MIEDLECRWTYDDSTPTYHLKSPRPSHELERGFVKIVVHIAKSGLHPRFRRKDEIFERRKVLIGFPCKITLAGAHETGKKIVNQSNLGAAYESTDLLSVLRKSATRGGGDI